MCPQTVIIWFVDSLHSSSHREKHDFTALKQKSLVLDTQDHSVCRSYPSVHATAFTKKNLRLSYWYIQPAIDILQKPLSLPVSLHLNFKLKDSSVKYMLIYDRYLAAVWNPLRNKEECKSNKVNYSYEGTITAQYTYLFRKHQPIQIKVRLFSVIFVSQMCYIFNHTNTCCTIWAKLK